MKQLVMVNSGGTASDGEMFELKRLIVLQGLQAKNSPFCFGKSL